MFNPFENLPQDEYEAKALKELMGLGLELPKARLLKILRENGGDAEQASVAAFTEMRAQYKQQFGGDDDDDDANNSNNKSAQQTEDEYAAYYGGGFETAKADPQVFFDSDVGGGMAGAGAGGGSGSSGRQGSFDMCFDANTDPQAEQAGLVEPIHGQFMLRVRSKEMPRYGGGGGNYDDDDDGDFAFEDAGGSGGAAAAAAVVTAGMGDQMDSSEYFDQLREATGGATAAAASAEQGDGFANDAERREAERIAMTTGGGPGGGPGIFKKSMGHGGFVGGRQHEGKYAGPTSFLNNGIVIVRLDTPGVATHTHNFSLVDTASLEDDDFEALCEEWLNERYENYERPDEFLQQELEFEAAKAKEEHDRKLFELFVEFEKSMSGGMSLEGALQTFTAANTRVQKKYRVAIGLDKPAEGDDDTDKKTTTTTTTSAAAKPDVVSASSRKNYYTGSSAARYAHVGKHVSDVSRTFRVSMTLPRTCTVQRVEVIRNTLLEKRFDRYCDLLQKQGIAFNIGTGYHGTSGEAVRSISETGFVCPLEGQRNVKHASGNAGFYGNGAYQSPDPNVAFWYSRDSQLLVCKCARGRVFKCPGLMMGADIQPGFDSHESPDGTEWVFYSSAAVLPIAIIHFSREVVAQRSTTVVTKATIRGKAVASLREDLDAKARGGGVHVSNKDRKTLNRLQGGSQGQRGKKKYGGGK